MIKDKPKVFVVQSFIFTQRGNYVPIEGRIFKERGYEVVHDPEKSDLIIFTGGEDINPAIYDEEPLPRTHFNKHRDEYELFAYNKLKDKIKVGICRGGQLLNCLNGGRLWQHVNNHSGIHTMLDMATGEFVKGNSIHHQMMIPSAKGEILTTANEATIKLSPSLELDEKDIKDWTDVEAVWYKDDKAFCYQGHPEYGHDTEKYFFKLLENLI